MYRTRTLVRNMVNNETLLERIGGISFVVIMLNALYDELLESPGLEHFFRRAPIEAIKTHQSVLFRVILGSEDCLPSQDKLINYMLASHSRLFREDGLNETHFDLVAECLVSTLHTFDVGQGIIEEILSILVPFRAVFEYGAKIAAKEKEMSTGERKCLPACSALTLGTDIPSILPNTPTIEVPSWLHGEIKKVTRKKSLHDWTNNLCDRCSATGDMCLADVMMDIPIYQLDSYMTNVLQLAFLPENMDADGMANTIKIVRHPRGLNKDPLSRSLFDRLVVEFSKTCSDMDVKTDSRKVLVEQLRGFRKSFPRSDPSHVPVNGVSNPSSMFFDQSPGVARNMLTNTSISASDIEEKNQAKRLSLSNKSTTETDDHSSILFLSPQKKNGTFQWFGKRKLNMNASTKLEL